MIPKKIHQIYWDFSNRGREISEDDYNNSLTYKDKNPNWEYKLWSLEDAEILLRDKFKWFEKTWVKLSNIMKCDSLRYMIMYDIGGCYADLDSICLKPLNDLCHHNIVLAKASHKVLGMDGIINCFMMSKPKQKLWMNLLRHIESYSDIQYIPNLMKVFITTGPIALTWHYKTYDEEIIAYDCHYFDCKPGKENQDTYVIHYGNVSWIEKKDKSNSYWYIGLIILILGLFIIGLGILLLI